MRFFQVAVSHDTLKANASGLALKKRRSGRTGCEAVGKKGAPPTGCRLFQRLNAESKIGVDTLRPVSYYAVRRVDTTVFQCGAIAQLGERLHGMQEVSGSIPLISTISLGFLAFFSGDSLRPIRLCRYAIWLRAQHVKAVRAVAIQLRNKSILPIQIGLHYRRIDLCSFIRMAIAIH